MWKPLKLNISFLYTSQKPMYWLLSKHSQLTQFKYIFDYSCCIHLNQVMFTVFIISLGLYNMPHALMFCVNSQQLEPISSKWTVLLGWCFLADSQFISLSSMRCLDVNTARSWFIPNLDKFSLKQFSWSCFHIAQQNRSSLDKSLLTDIKCKIPCLESHILLHMKYLKGS